MDMQKRNQLTDLTVQTADKVLYKVHRWILLNLSRKLVALSSSGDLSSWRWGVPLPELHVDVPSHTMEQLINLAYTGRCQLTQDQFLPLLLAAHTYDIGPLLKLCGDYLLSSVTAASTMSSLSSPVGATFLVESWRLAQCYLCSHVVDRLDIHFRRQFPDHMGPGGAAFLLTPREVARLVAHSDLPLRESQVVQFILEAAERGGWTRRETAALLEQVRFTLIPHQDLIQLLADDRMAPFVEGPTNVEALARVRQAKGLLPPTDMRQRLRPVAVGHEEARFPRQLMVVMGGWAAAPPGPTNVVEIYNYITDSWTQSTLQLPTKLAYHGLVLHRNQVKYVCACTAQSCFGGYLH
jgi:hypothetical protein